MGQINHTGSKLRSWRKRSIVLRKPIGWFLYYCNIDLTRTKIFSSVFNFRKMNFQIHLDYRHNVTVSIFGIIVYLAF